LPSGYDHQRVRWVRYLTKAWVGGDHLWARVGRGSASIVTNVTEKLPANEYALEVPTPGQSKTGG
jgi:hypothetical protein